MDLLTKIFLRNDINLPPRYYVSYILVLCLLMRLLPIYANILEIIRLIPGDCDKAQSDFLFFFFFLPNSTENFHLKNKASFFFLLRWKKKILKFAFLDEKPRGKIILLFKLNDSWQGRMSNVNMVMALLKL